MEFGEIPLHKKFHLLIASCCAQFVVDGKRESFVSCVFRHSADLELDSVGYAVAEFSFLVVAWVYHGVCWL